MSARRDFNANRSSLPVVIIGVALAVPVLAQDPTGTEDMSSMRDMQMQKMQPQAVKPSAPTSSTSDGESMPGMDMPRMNMPGMQMPREKPERPKKQGPAKRGGKPSMSAMKAMPVESSQSAEMQHLNFGAMIGTRPKPGGLASSVQGMSPMRGMDISAMQGGSAPASARSADYSDGYRSGPMRGMDMPDDAFLGMVILDQLEYAHSAHSNAQFIDGQAWYGTNFEKLWIKAEGEVSRGRLSDLRTEALWDHAITSYWSTQLGVRRDFGVGPDRTWAAIGVQGLAPFWFDTEVTLYVGEGARTAVRLQVDYEAPLTQRLILQPKVEMNLYARDDPLRAIGEGLSDAEFGLRLRYEIRPELAPYIGIVYRQRYGHAADFARAQGEHSDDLQWVAGVHVWF